MKILVSLLIIASCAMSAQLHADTAAEVRAVVVANIEYTNKELAQDPQRISSKGSKEFFSSGGLLNEINRASLDNTFVAFKGSVKHIDVTVLVEGEAAEDRRRPLGSGVGFSSAVSCRGDPGMP